MPHKRAFFRKIIWLGMVAMLWLAADLGSTAAQAQEGAPRPGSRLFISGTNAGTAPTVDVYVYGFDGAGQPLALTPAQVVVQHNGEQALDVQVAGLGDAGTLPPNTTGTFTLFLVDTPPGVSDSLPTLQNAILTYASNLYMREDVDYIAIYQVGETGAQQLLAPTGFHNAVINFFGQPLPTLSGPTALVDSAVGLLASMPSLLPHPGLAPSLVIISDGTDVVSTQHEPAALYQTAAAQGIPIHTIWLDNANLNLPEPGRDYLRTVAGNARGLAGTLDDAESLTAIWARIAQFSPRTIIRYTIRSKEHTSELQSQ